ncbi:MAG: leucyl aminopeptidase [Kofleriaceae bacterium]|nr:MAG: leucyl aminopeptidase [Kofleriaceae bacterium]MBZ0235843.1 leucyl aminopeptidase [Kofleriaceae bacterium]
MEFSHVVEPALTASTDLLVMVAFGDPTKDPTFRTLDTATGKGLSEAARSESFEGKAGQSLVFWANGAVKAKRIAVLGAGPKAEVELPALRDVGAIAAQIANKVGAKSLALVVPSFGAPREPAAIQMVAEGSILGTYKFGRYLTGAEAKKSPSLQHFGFIVDTKGKKPTAAQTRAFKGAVERAEVVAAAISRARDMVNEPAAYMTPTQVAAEAEAIAKKHDTVTVHVLGAKKCEDLGMGMFLAVGKGSDQEPKLVHLVYKPKKAKKKIALIGKGVTFDSGGYSLKPSNAMEDMKVDMSGAAAVIAAMDAIATLGCEHEVHAVAACCENLVSGRAYKLGDVLTSMDGTTVEINNTDAEGRLTLGDAITYVRTKIQPDEMFDFATLTGACMVALGPYTAGVMSDHDGLCRAWLAAAERAGEDMWRLPLTSRLREQLKSPVADMRNTGDRFGGAITAGLFLKTFAKDTPWVHVDIAGPASISSSRPCQPRGGTGFAVASIVEYLAKR